MYKKIFISILMLMLTVSCSNKKQKKFRFKTNMKVSEVDTNSDKQIDTRGYYMDDDDNIRLIYNEIDRNLDGFSDYFVWVGSSPAPKQDVKVKDITKVHEEEDEDYDGKVDSLKWYLPNDYIALSQHDKNKDGYFETTIYYNFRKVPVRTEIDTNFDGRADQILWESRAEIDSDFDGIPDSYTTAPTKLLLEDQIQNKTNLKPLGKKDSWFLNPALAPLELRAIIGSGYF